jgi:heat shock protein HtpX
MELTAYRALEANRRRSRVLAALSAALLAALFPLAVWLLGPNAVRPASSLAIFLGAAMFGGREITLAMLHARAVTASQQPRLFRRLEVVAAGLGQKTLPAVYLVARLPANALAIERVGQAGTLVITDRLLDLGDDELDGVLAHELFHIATAVVGLRSALALCRGLVMAMAVTRVRWHQAAMVLVAVFALLALGPAPIILVAFMAVFLVADARISRQREFLADAQAVLITRYPEGLIRALRLLSALPSTRRVVPPASSTTTDGERLAASLWTVRPNALDRGWSTRLFDAHPSTAARIERLTRMS